VTLTPISTASLATARLHALLDTSEPHADVAGVVVMTGTVAGTPVIAFATDSTVQGGALGIDGCRAIADATNLAVRRGIPVIGIWHSGGARLREGVGALDAVAAARGTPVEAVGRIRTYLTDVADFLVNTR